MATVTGTLQGIADIEAPTAPYQHALISSGELIVAALVLLSLLVIVATAVWRRYFSTRGRARRDLSRLRAKSSKLNQHGEDPHRLAFGIAAVLRHGLDIKHISPTTRLPPSLSSDAEQWHEYANALAQARYAAEQIDKEQLARLFDESDRWLRRWPHA